MAPRTASSSHNHDGPILSFAIMDKFQVYRPTNARSTSFRSLLAAILLVVITASSFGVTLDWNRRSTAKVPINAAEIVSKCQALHVLPAPPSNFYERTESDRYAAGTPPTLLKNATIWTGRVSGHEVVVGDILLDKGLIKEVGDIKQSVLDNYKDLVVLEAEGAWITPGYIFPR